MHRLHAARDEMMPPKEVAAFLKEPVGACFRQPIEFPDMLGLKLDAIGYMPPSILIIRTPARADIQKAAGKARERNLAGVLILKFDKAAPAAAVAKRFPFSGCHLRERFHLPKRRTYLRPIVLVCRGAISSAAF